jgi:DNA-binding NtrC family response regulator
MRLIDAKVEHLAKTLKHTNGNKAKAARILGLSESAFHKWCKKYKVILVTTKDSLKPRVVAVKYSIPMEIN